MDHWPLGARILYVIFGTIAFVMIVYVGICVLIDLANKHKRRKKGEA